MININKNNFVGKGHNREVYRHPENPSLCIKVAVHNKIEDRQERREKKYYKLLQKRGVSWDMIPKYHGDIETNLGTGSVFDLIVDHDGSVSKTLADYLSHSHMTKIDYDNLSNSLKLLKKYLLEQQIITMTIADRNLVCQKNKSGIFQLFVIDNIGNSDFIPICNYISRLAKKKINRRWERFEKRLIKAYPDNKTLHQMLM